MASRTEFVDGFVDDNVAEGHLLRSVVRPKHRAGSAVFVVDLFSGCGGLSVGVGEAIAAVGHTAHYAGFDTDESALGIYGRNLPHSTTHARDLSDQLDGALGMRVTRNEKLFLKDVPRCDVLVAGPPCQGHSAANNRTRHRDARNQLFMTTVRAAELMEPEHLIVENVPGALNDRSGVVFRAVAELERIGYRVSTEIVDASELGVPQRRRRLVLLATRSQRPSLEGIASRAAKKVRTVRWAFADLQDVSPSSVYDEPARSAPQTIDRIDTLFDQDLYELPDEYRPPCHASGGHSYVSIYGRLRWDEPAQTLTTGFYSMCMGRYVHPSRRRTITAHEAARIQGLPDWFSFGDLTKRVDLSRMIGNAVPPRLGYAAALELLR